MHKNTFRTGCLPAIIILTTAYATAIAVAVIIYALFIA